jgi:hypothetical protein
MKLLQKDKIKKGLNEQKITYPLEDRENIERVFYELEGDSKLEIAFSIYLRGDNSGDYWLQAEFYSNKIGKTIIWDYDFADFFENEKELIECILETQSRIKDFEAKLTLIK